MVYRVLIIYLLLVLNCGLLVLSAPSFTLQFKLYDFKPSQPGFNISFDEFQKAAKTAPKSGMIKDEINPITHKPQYCCGDNSFSYMPSQNAFDKCYIESSDTKTMIGSAPFYKFTYSDRSISYQSVQKFYYPFNNKGWNDANPNLYWCMEGHFEFKLTSNKDQSLSIQFDGDRFVFVNGKKVIEYINIDEINSVYRPTDLELYKNYPLDIFLCQRFDKYTPSKMLSIMSSFLINCVNIPGVNDDACPYIRPACNERDDCNDNNKCTVDKCPSKDVNIPRNDTYSSYCTHTLIECSNNNDKCLNSLGCNAQTGQCETTKVECSDNIECTIDSCDSNTGCKYVPDNSKCSDNINCTTDTCTSNGCTHTPNDSLCNDNDPCTIDKCTNNGCAHTPMECNNDPNNQCITNSCVEGECIKHVKSCPTKKLLGILPLLCQKQKCNPSNAECISDGSSLIC